MILFFLVSALHADRVGSDLAVRAIYLSSKKFGCCDSFATRINFDPVMRKTANTMGSRNTHSNQSGTQWKNHSLRRCVWAICI